MTRVKVIEMTFQKINADIEDLLDNRWNELHDSWKGAHWQETNMRLCCKSSVWSGFAW